VILYALDSANI